MSCRKFHTLKITQTCAMFVGIGLVVSLSSCFKEDEPVPPYESPAGVSTVMAATGKDYSVQTYYDLESNQFVSSNHRENWDLAFDCAADGHAVYLNSSKKMSVIRLQSKDIFFLPANLNDTNVVKRHYDESTGNKDSTAFGHWGTSSGNDLISDSLVYIIDRGYITTGQLIGMKKIIFTGLNSGIYSFKVAELDGSGIQNFQITKDPSRNFVFFSFENGGQQVNIEPPKNSYDLLFTQYTTRVYYGPNDPKFEWYSVNGVLMNPGNVGSVVDSITPFNDIDFNKLADYSFSYLNDAIGYSWKSYNINTGDYSVFSNRTYIIKNRLGNYYKIRFIGFTNAQGEHGYPSFELKKI